MGFIESVIATGPVGLLAAGEAIALVAVAGALVKVTLMFIRSLEDRHAEDKVSEEKKLEMDKETNVTLGNLTTSVKTLMDYVGQKLNGKS